MVTGTDASISVLPRCPYSLPQKSLGTGKTDSPLVVAFFEFCCNTVSERDKGVAIGILAVAGLELGIMFSRWTSNLARE